MHVFFPWCFTKLPFFDMMLYLCPSIAVQIVHMTTTRMPLMNSHSLQVYFADYDSYHILVTSGIFLFFVEPPPSPPPPLLHLHRRFLFFPLPWEQLDCFYCCRPPKHPRQASCRCPLGLRLRVAFRAWGRWDGASYPCLGYMCHSTRDNNICRCTKVGRRGYILANLIRVLAWPKVLHSKIVKQLQPWCHRLKLYCTPKHRTNQHEHKTKITQFARQGSIEHKRNKEQKVNAQIQHLKAMYIGEEKEVEAC